MWFEAPEFIIHESTVPLFMVFRMCLADTVSSAAQRTDSATHLPNHDQLREWPPVRQHQPLCRPPALHAVNCCHYVFQILVHILPVHVYAGRCGLW